MDWIQRYEDFNTNDKVKSLIRLLDKSTELSRVIAAEGIPDQENLDRYVEDQRLSGVLILDENMRVVLQNSQNGDTMPIWENQISGVYVRDILKHRRKPTAHVCAMRGYFMISLP